MPKTGNSHTASTGLYSRAHRAGDTIITIGAASIGGGAPFIIAGPCAVENEQQTVENARLVKDAGAMALRGGAFKPRTSPYSFQGAGETGLQWLAAAREATGLPVVTEVLTAEDVPMVAQYADVLQVGSRNMHNFSLLKAVGRQGKPVLLKRGMSATLHEFLMSAEYILLEGNGKVILCERGIRTFVDYTRNTLDLNIVPAIREATHLPIIVDPSHGTGRRSLVPAMSMAAIAAGAQGLIIEVHPHPDQAISDGDQTVTVTTFATIVRQIHQLYTLRQADAPDIHAH